MTTTSPEATAEATKALVEVQQSSVTEVFSVLFGGSNGDAPEYDHPASWYLGLLFVIGWVAAIVNGLVMVSMAFLFAESFTDITGAATNGLDDTKDLVLLIVYVGAVGFVAASVQTWSFETCAYYGSHSLRLQWFAALLRQDAAYFDVHDISGTAAEIGASVIRFRRGTGRKFGEGIQFITTGVGGIAFGFYSQWKIAFLLLALVPFVAYIGMCVMEIYRTKSTRAAASYKAAGSIAYTAVSAIRTVLSLNAVPEFLRQYSVATQEAYKSSTASILKEGLANGGMLCGIILQYFVLVLFGTWLIWRDVADSGCDPSGAVKTNNTCDISASEIFGSMLGIAFAAMGLSQCGNSAAAFSAARVALFQAQQAIQRRPGAPSQTIYKSPTVDLSKDGATTKSDTHRQSSSHSTSSPSPEEPIVRAILPAYEIDSTATTGWKPSAVSGAISFRNVSFSYPTRPTEPVLCSLNMEIGKGETIALVGPSGAGKSSVASLLERFYDPTSGTICIDDRDIKEWNVGTLRKAIGYVGQEPMLFAASIRQNILYGNPAATQEQIEEAARLANAHDFIRSFSDGYNTQVGDKGSQLSGGQKQVRQNFAFFLFAPQLVVSSSHFIVSELLLLESLWETRRYDRHRLM
jgi:ATP-binding cassette, subfamily B (MDR/TAP), member 1